LFVSPCKHDGLVQRHWLLERDISAQQLAQTDNEELYLLVVCDGWVPARQSHEILAVIIDGPVLAELSEYTNQTIH
jgi:hypothetical protein